MYRDENAASNDDLDVETPEPREFDVNPATGKVGIVTRHFQELERQEIEEELEEAEAAQVELLAREEAATKARGEGDRRVASLKSELEGFDEAARRAGADPWPAGDGSEDTPGAEEPDPTVALD